MITLPTSTITDISGIMTGIFTDFSELIMMIIGASLGFWLAGKIIRMIRDKEDGPWKYDKDGMFLDD